MQQVDSYGQNLPDQVDRIAGLFDAHLGLIIDVCSSFGKIGVGYLVNLCSDSRHLP
jgi:hypothetical protein